MANNQLKIVLILGSDKWGGGEKHVFDIIKNLKGRFQFVLVSKKSTILKHKFASLDIPHVEWEMDFTLANFKLHFKQIQWLNSMQADGIHCHLNDASFILSIYRPFVSTKFISTVHGFSSHLYYLFPHHIISVSKAIHNYLLPVSKKKSTVIYNGVCHEQIIEKPPAQLQAYVFATIHPNKGQEFVCNTLKDIQFQTKITFIGTGNKKYQNRLSQLVQDSNSKIDWMNINQDLQKYFENASFVIIPSYQEALSYVALEALSRGIPVLASATGGLIEVFENNKQGLFFKTGNSIDFIEKLHLMEKQHHVYRDNLINEPFLKNNSQFHVDEMCQKICKYYLDTFRK